MSYPTIALATLKIAAADKSESSHDIAVLKYPAPKRDAKGTINVFGTDASFRTTSGKNRAGEQITYLYVTVKGQSGFFPLPAERVAALPGATLTLTERVVAPVVVADAPTEPVAEPVVAEPVVAEPVVAEPVVAEPVVAEPVAPTLSKRAQRRRAAAEA